MTGADVGQMSRSRIQDPEKQRHEPGQVLFDEELIRPRDDLLGTE
jgi:hypothetical protein